MKTITKKLSSGIYYYLNSDFNNEKETIIFLHPAFADHRSFDSQIDYFYPNYNVITIDLIGHGQSQGMKTKDKIDSTSRHILEIMDTEQIDSIHLIGISVGGLLVQDFANKYFSKVKSIVAVGAYDINNYDPSFEKSQRKQQMSFMLKAIFSMKAFSRSNAEVSAYSKRAQDMFYEMNLGFKRSSFKYMTSLNNIMNTNSHYSNIPLLIMYGEYDSDLAIKMSQRWIDSSVRCETSVIKEAGHCANMDNSIVFNEEVMSFYDSFK